MVRSQDFNYQFGIACQTNDNTLTHRTGTDRVVWFDSRHGLLWLITGVGVKQKGRCRREYDLFCLGREFGARHLNVGSALKVAYISLEWSSKIASPVAAAGVTGSTARVLSPGQRREVSWAVEERGCQCEWGHSGTDSLHRDRRSALVQPSRHTRLCRRVLSASSQPWNLTATCLLSHFLSGQVLNFKISGPLYTRSFYEYQKDEASRTLRMYVH